MKGKKTGGRTAGTKNKATQFKESAARLTCNPFEVLARIAAGDLPCNVCRGTGKTMYQPSRQTRLIDGVRTYVMADGGDEGEARLRERTCLSCYGSGKERISPELRAKTAAELAQYEKPKLKAVEHTGPDGGPMQAKIQVVFVDA